MTERDEPKNKITQLFPSSSSSWEEESIDEETRQAESAAETELFSNARERAGELHPETEENEENEENEEENEEEELAEEEERDESPVGDNVVRLNFGQPRKSESPSSPAAAEPKSAPASPRDFAKFKLFSKIIEEGMVMVTLDTRVDGVVVPPKFQGLPELRLNFSHLFQLSDFAFDPAGVRASLSFQGERHLCDVPWPAVRMLYSHESGEAYVFDPLQS